MSGSRDREQTKGRLIAAVGELIESEGVGALGVNAIAKRAGVNKVLIYRYFDGLHGLYRAYGELSDIWPTKAELLGDLLDVDVPMLPALQKLLRNYYEALARRPATIDLLAWECVGRNELIVMLEELREAAFFVLVSVFQERGFQLTTELNQLLVLLFGAIHYFLIRRRNIVIFAGVDIRSDEGWMALFERIDAMLAMHINGES